MSKSTNFMFNTASVNTPAKDQPKEYWNVLLVDDEEDVHSVTKLVLKNFEFDSKKLKFHSAYSREDAKNKLKDLDNIAVALIDVVMEEDDAGLKLIDEMRNDLRILNTRIILRTGQPGQAPEKDVINNYDINDYKNKTELTDIKMHTLMCSTLRSYRDIITLEKSRAGLEKVISSSATIFERFNIERFVSAALYQFLTLLDLGSDAAHIKAGSGMAINCDDTNFRVRAGIGIYEKFNGEALPQELHKEISPHLEKAIKEGKNQYGEDYVIAHFIDTKNIVNLLYIHCYKEISEIDQHMIDLFCRNVSIAFHNAQLREDIENTQSEVICLLGEAVENRSKETGNHIKRVAEICYILANAAGLNEEEAINIKFASPLHDLGKIGIPDAILHKPGKHDADETLIMRQHVDIGYNMLKNSDRPILKIAANIAGQHHEKYDGTGYPEGLKGDEITIAGRISAIADVFDALITDRCYKKAWPLEKVLSLFQEEKAKHFDPEIVDLLNENLDAILEIIKKYP